MKLPLLLLAALALPAGAADYYLLGDDTGGSCSLNGEGTPVGWATTSGGAKVRSDTSDASGVFHLDGHLMRIAVTTANLSFGGARLVFDGAKPAINDKCSANETLTLDHVYVPAGNAGELPAPGSCSTSARRIVRETGPARRPSRAKAPSEPRRASTTPACIRPTAPPRPGP